MIRHLYLCLAAGESLRVAFGGIRDGTGGFGIQPNPLNNSIRLEIRTVRISNRMVRMAYVGSDQ